MISKRVGNIFETGCKTIGHGVNCYGVMGAGIAKAIRFSYAGAFEAYMEEFQDGKSMQPGQIKFVQTFPHNILHMATQLKPGKEAKLEYIQRCLLNLHDSYETLSITTIAFPHIGCGIGGLDWVDVEPLFDVLKDTKMRVELWSKK